MLHQVYRSNNVSRINQVLLSNEVDYVLAPGSPTMTCASVPAIFDFS
jgi:hypothetical protein